VVMAIRHRTTAYFRKDASDDARSEFTICESEPTVTVRKEPDYWSGGHFHEGSRPYIYIGDIASLPVGTLLYRKKGEGK